MATNFESEPPLTPTEQDQTKPEYEKISLKAKAIMAMIAIGLSMAATFGANEVAKNKPPEMPTQTTFEVPEGGMTSAGADLGLFQVVPGEQSVLPPLPGVKLDIENIDPDKTVVAHLDKSVSVQQMEWSRAFDTGPEASNPRGIDAIHDALYQVESLTEDGWDLESITFQGAASDEGDDRQGDNPGFGLKTNEKNIRLANKRASAVRALFTSRLDKKAETYPVDTAAILSKITEIGGEEVRDDELAGQIDAMAHKLGMPMDDMVMQFNRDPSSLPPEAQKVLEGLVDNRFVRIEIKASKTMTAPGKVEKNQIIIVPIIPIPIRRKKPAAPEEPRAKAKPPVFDHAPKKIGDVRQGYWQVAGHNKDPNTHNGGHSKGSGGNFAAKVHTTHRGNQARKH